MKTVALCKNSYGLRGIGRTFALILFLFLPLVLNGCGRQITPAEIAALDFGPYPEDYKDILADFLDYRTDVLSFRILKGNPVQRLHSQVIYDDTPVYGWSGKVRVTRAREVWDRRRREFIYVGKEIFIHTYYIRYGMVVGFK